MVCSFVVCNGPYGKHFFEKEDGDANKVVIKGPKVYRIL